MISKTRRRKLLNWYKKIVSFSSIQISEHYTISKIRVSDPFKYEFTKSMSQFNLKDVDIKGLK